MEGSVSQEPKCFFLSPEVHSYLVQHGTPPDEIEQALIDETQQLGGLSVMQIAPEQGALMTLLTRVTGARRAVEVGTFTGYSALCIARGLPIHGQLLCCDVNEAWSAIAQRHWEKAGVADRIELRLGPALDTLRALPEHEIFDLAFIDADKESYIHYFEEILKRLHPNGLILVDNVLLSGCVAERDRNDALTVAIRNFNDHVADDPRVDCVMLSVADGLTLLRKHG
jgi:caffeoyl-CoA O-methyltransferase